MDYNNKMFNSMDKDHTNFTCLCLAESKERKPAKTKRKMAVITLKGLTLLPESTQEYSIPESFKIFWKWGIE